MFASCIFCSCCLRIQTMDTETVRIAMLSRHRAHGKGGEVTVTLSRQVGGCVQLEWGGK